jgi:hypothetical protein
MLGLRSFDYNIKNQIIIDDIWLTYNSLSGNGLICFHCVRNAVGASSIARMVIAK